ncbi:MAG: DUF2242 domain-containing protein [Zoogloeaceae bacterium]|nr:DUF2242 domain-containing protein [Zoogloeaceae bacterium]
MLPSRFVSALIPVLYLAACATPQPVHLVERFDPQSPYQHFFRTNKEAACDAGRRALLSQGYVVERPSADVLQGTKFFQPDPERSTTLQVSLVCTTSGGGAVIYANARELRFALKAGGSSAGLSVAGLGSISLPWGAANENLIKTGEATVTDTDFYQRFFSLVDIEVE